MLIITFLILILNLIVLPQSIKENVDKAIENCFGKTIRIEYDKLKIEDKLKIHIEKEVGQKFYSDEVYLYRIFNENNLIGYGLLDNVIGKSLPITFLVLYDNSGTILCSEIIKYREPYGGAVQSKDWNEQFKGKNHNSDFKVGKDINGISGATISVYSVTKGIKKLTLLLNNIFDK
jgi:Na+-translocating ferredoxin:NAD+ oxidoreductase RnfG subunit